jgi:hypothetical protein
VGVRFPLCPPIFLNDDGPIAARRSFSTPTVKGG